MGYCALPLATLDGRWTTFPYHNYGPLEGGATTLEGRCTTFPYRNYGPPEGGATALDGVMHDVSLP